MASLQTLELRIKALEARLADMEGSYGATLYKLHRHAIKTDLALASLLGRAGLQPIPEEAIDAVLDAEQ